MENPPGSKFELDPSKRALLDAWLREKNLGAPAVRIPRRVESGPVPLSFAQQRMWFLHQIEQDSEVYSVPIAFRLRGTVDLDALERSINRIIARHEILRTTFPEMDGEICQVVAESYTLKIEAIDLRNELPSAADQHSLQILYGKGRERFNLRDGPLLKVCFLRLSDDDAIILFNFHHIVIDEWSIGLFLNELGKIYSGEIGGIDPDLPELQIQYADFAIWQNEDLDGPTAERQLDYWKKKLERAPVVLELPTDHTRPAAQNFQGGMRTRRLRNELMEGLRALSRKERTTLFTAFMAIFQVLLYRFTGQKDFLVGSPIANRRQLELENLIGYFLNTLVFRAQFLDPVTFREYLKRSSTSVLDAMENQDLPFERLVEELKPQRELSRHPLFQTALTFHPRGSLKFDLGDVNTEQVIFHLGRSKFDLILFVHERFDGAELQMEYCLDLFEANTIDRLLERLEILIESILKDPDQRVDYLEMLSEEELGQIIIGWNRTKREYPRDLSIQELFSRQVEQNPNAVCIVHSEGDELNHEEIGSEISNITYRELDEGSNQLARLLQTYGVKPGDIVGICLGRGAQTIEAFLGVLKAGGGYMPLDTTYPAERIKFMIEDSGCVTVISDEANQSLVKELGVQVILIDADWEAIERQETSGLVRKGSGNDLAYVMYTSGSTGKPKGIAIPHRGVTRLVCNSDYVHITCGDCIAQASNMSFDAATFEIWGALLNSGKLAIAHQEIILNAGKFGRWLRQHDVRVLFLTTALFNQIAMLEPTAFSCLRDMLFGGEMVTPVWVKAILEAGAPQRLLHVYGPTENTTFTTWHYVDKVEDISHTIPIGRPIANSRVYVLDQWNQPVPPGSPGELCISGDGLATGYIQRPELTAERFVPDPFGEPGSRMYRTGDLVRYLSDGRIEYLSRLDQQIKLRGFRVELGEIENAINAHPDVHQSVVILHKTGSGLESDQQLAAYIVKKPGTSVSTHDLRTNLMNRLPGYMIPAAFIFLEEIPINPNGKVDRAALPIPASDASVSIDKNIEPRNDHERWLCGLWERVLNVRKVGIRDNFFELGGHSLLAVRLFAHIEQETGQRIPLATLFQTPTVEGLAEVLNRERQTAEWTALVAIQPGGNRPPFYCVHNFGGEALDLAPLSRALGEDQPFFGLQALGLDGVAEPHTTIEEMANYYLAAIRKYQPKGPYYLGGFCFGGVVAYEMACQLQKNGEKSALLVVVDASAPGYAVEKGRLTLKEIGATLVNIPIWLHDFFQMNSAERKVVVRRRIKRIGKAVERTVGIEAEMSPLEIIGDHVHVMEAPAHRRHLMELHIQAIMKYRPSIFQGRVTAIRVRGVPLFSRRAYDMGWSKVAKEGVDIRMVVGAHHNVMRAPYVHDLAAQIRECMDQTLKDQ